MTDKPTARSILVIDSGVGGLSVCEAILAKDPLINIIYYADDAYFPYGLLSEGELINRLHAIVRGMLESYQPELIVLACNTVSTLVLPELRAKYDVPFVGVVPAIKPAATLSESKRIGLLATPATVNRTYTDGLIKEFAPECEVVRVGSNDLVLQAERLISGAKICKDTVFEAIKPLLTRYNKLPIDTVVLGCTHFPFLKGVLNELMPGVRLVDSGEAIARRTADLLGVSVQLPIESNRNNIETHKIHFSKQLPNEDGFRETLSTLGMKQVDLILAPIDAP